MQWSSDFVDLILRFANRVAEVGAIELDEALLHWTPLPPNFGLSRPFDPRNPIWHEFLTGYHQAPNPIVWTHSFYLAHRREFQPPPEYGCFAYHYEEPVRTIRFHFLGYLDTSGLSPISQEREPVRRGELTAMFSDIRREVPQAEAVRGRSWMYNLPNYRRLFPPEYIRTATPIEPELQFMSLWGQFLNRRGEVRPEPAARFLAALSAASTTDDVVGSFLLDVLAPRGSIDHFYAFYGIGE